MKVNKGYKYRIYPTKEQEQLLAKTFGCVRFIYNHMYADSQKHYEKTKKIKINTPATYKGNHEFLQEVDSLALCNAQLALRKAYTGYFNKAKQRSKKIAEAEGDARKLAKAYNYAKPKFKSKKDSYQSYTTNNQGGSIRIKYDKIKIPKLGWVKVKFHREIFGNIKSCTITKLPTGSYEISILVQYERNVKLLPVNKAIGLDYSSPDFYIDDYGEKANYPRYYRKSQAKTKKLSRELSRKKKDSNNRQKSRLKLAKHYRKVANQRNDFLHKLSRSLVNNYDLIAVEDINLHSLAQSLNYGKSTHDNGFGTFRTYLKYKCEDAGKHFIVIDKWFASSKICNDCGCKTDQLNEKIDNLKIREWTCEHCGSINDRDTNAAKNIVQYALNRWNSGDSLINMLALAGSSQETPTSNPIGLSGG